MPRSFTNLLYHIVFSTKERRPFITPDIESRVYDYVGGIVHRTGGILLDINGMPDHVHLQVRWRTDKSVSELVRDVKSNSSGWIHRTFPEEWAFGWQGSYAAFSVSASQRGRVSNYIQGQKSHHAKQDYMAELKALLKAHEITIDEQYLK